MKTEKSKTEKINVKKEFEQVRVEIKRLDTKIDEVEKRLEFKIDSKVDIATQSMKDYVDIKFNQMQTNFNQLGNKFDTAVKGIVDMIERSLGDQVKIENKVDDHEQRISLLETKVG